MEVASEDLHTKSQRDASPTPQHELVEEFVHHLGQAVLFSNQIKLLFVHTNKKVNFKAFSLFIHKCNNGKRTSRTL